MIILAFSLFIGFIWGITNPFIKLATSKDDNIKSLLTNIHFLIPYLLNQLASIGYNFLLTFSDLHIIIPIVKTMDITTTVLATSYLEKKSLKIKDFVGIVLITIGIIILETMSR